MLMGPDWRLEVWGHLSHPKLCFRSYYIYPKSLIKITHDLTELGTWRMLMVPDCRLEGCGHIQHPKLCFRSYWRYPESLNEIAHNLTEFGGLGGC